MINLLLKFGGLQALLLVVFLVRKKANNKANKILVLLVFLLGFSCVVYSFNNLDFYIQFPHFIRIDWGIPLLFGPLIYLYTKRLLNKEKSQEKDSLHFLPYFINVVVLIPFFIKPSEKKIQILDYFTASITGGTDYYSFYNFLLKLIISIVSISYAYNSIKIVQNYKDKLLSEYSSTEKLRLDWLRDFLYCFMLLSVAFAIISLITYGDRYPQFDYFIYYYLFVFLLIYIVSYKAYSQPQIVDFHDSNTIREEKIKHKPKSFDSNVKSFEQVELIKRFMINSKPYLIGELTASELAKMLSISRHELSQLLNNHLNQNFYDFINEHRISEFKTRIEMPENNHLTLLGVAFDSGFNSKTTFNTIFKKSTGLTPSQYKKSIK